ncbi:MAG: PsbP-related protein [bacterium]|nr:PsbP-related protein [bacterium]
MENQGQDTNQEPTTDNPPSAIGKERQTSNPEPSKSKGLIWFLVAIIAILLGVVGYFLLTGDRQSTTDNEDQNIEKEQSSLSDLKTYKDEEYGFELKYPAEYTLSENLGKKGFYDYEITEILKISGTGEYINDSGFYLSADDNPSNVASCLSPKEYENGNISTKNINGSTFYVFFDKAPDSAMGGARGMFSDYRIVKNGYCYTLRTLLHWSLVGYGGYVRDGEFDATPEEIQGQKDAIEKHELILDEILATFKFTR